ncbi:uncharacterized protein KY384_004731 [Bacidia gigantensis]|uniref:uncharacterized protein n=1 Tax=Bacidia gigantensis TaxID=2732470 RepID=UPI001D046DFE|nr:uncharacterized protein KY384_004731 [Bacidia gigantensis]KAG8530231.1 hypothetical protein KY384_004731 [Bacidia gigantensis]
MPMDRFPQELLKIIVDHVDCFDDHEGRQALKSLRLVSSTFSNLAAVPLFRTVPLWIGLQSLTNLSNIAEHPSLSKYVTKIIFSPLQIRTYDNETKRSAEILDRFEVSSNSANEIILSNLKYTQAYGNYRRMQIALATHNQDKKIVVRAFRLLSNLTRLEVDSSRTRIGAAELRSAFGVMDGSELTMRGEYTIDVLLRALKDSGIKLSALVIRHSETFVNRKSPRAFGRPPPLLLKSDLDYDRISLALPEPQRFTSAVDNLEIRGLASMLEPEEEHLKAVVIRRLIELGRTLKKLDIGELGDFGLSNMCPLREIFRFITFRHLESLSLSWFNCQEQEIVELLSHITKSIVQVDLALVKIEGQGWSSVLTSLRQRSFKSLTSFVLTFCHDEEEFLHVERYIKKQTKTNPLEQFES